MTLLSATAAPKDTIPAPPPVPAVAVTTEISSAFRLTLPSLVTSELFEMCASIVLTTTLTTPEPCTATPPAPVPPAATPVTTATEVAVSSTNCVPETAELSM